MRPRASLPRRKSTPPRLSFSDFCPYLDRRSAPNTAIARQTSVTRTADPLARTRPARVDWLATTSCQRLCLPGERAGRLGVVVRPSEQCAACSARRAAASSLPRSAGTTQRRRADRDLVRDRVAQPRGVVGDRQRDGPRPAPEGVLDVAPAPTPPSPKVHRYPSAPPGFGSLERAAVKPTGVPARPRGATNTARGADARVGERGDGDPLRGGGLAVAIDDGQDHGVGARLRVDVLDRGAARLSAVSEVPHVGGCRVIRVARPRPSERDDRPHRRCRRG